MVPSNAAQGPENHSWIILQHPETFLVCLAQGLEPSVAGLKFPEGQMTSWQPH